jgi:hypothetical protein
LPPAAFHAGITGRLFKLEASSSPYEGRRLGGDVSRLNMSDGNHRTAGELWWNERLVSGPRFKFDGSVSLYTSRNSARDRPYFNPERDRQISVSASAEWLTTRRYDRSFRQRMIATAGSYWQKRFGSGAAAELRYEHEWGLGELFGVRYGVGHSVHPYDGKREGRTFAYLTANKIF